MAFNDDAKEMIKEINILSGFLSEWEEGFMVSIEQRVSSGIQLTVKQMQKLQDIYEEVTERQFRDERMDRDD
jgi:hypothetical protein